MDGRYILILLAQTGTHEDGLVDGGQFVDTIHEVGAALYHTLVDKFLERLFLAAHTVVVEELIPETGVDKVTGGMLRTADVEVDVTPVLVGVL